MEKKLNSIVPITAAVLGIGWALWEATFTWYRMAGIPGAVDRGGLGLLVELGSLVAPWVVIAASAWLLTKKTAAAALILFGAFLFKFLQYLFPIAIPSFASLFSGRADELTGGLWLNLAIFFVFTMGLCLAWLAYRAANIQARRPK